MLEDLRSELEEYYGAINELRAGLHARIPEKPEELVRYEMCLEMGIPLVAGGIMDQPHIWLKQYAVVKQTKDLFEALMRKGNDSQQNRQQ